MIAMFYIYMFNMATTGHMQLLSTWNTANATVELNFLFNLIG